MRSKASWCGFISIVFISPLMHSEQESDKIILWIPSTIWFPGVWSYFTPAFLHKIWAGQFTNTTYIYFLRSFWVKTIFLEGWHWYTSVFCFFFPLPRRLFQCLCCLRDAFQSAIVWSIIFKWVIDFLFICFSMDIYWACTIYQKLSEKAFVSMLENLRAC